MNEQVSASAEDIALERLKVNQKKKRKKVMLCKVF